MKKETILKAIIILAVFISSGFCQAETPKSYYYDLIEVDIEINKDSTFYITETQTFNLNGNFGFFFRDIELKNLDHISNVEAYDGQGRVLPKEELKISYKGNRLSVRWDFPRRDFNNELKSWKIKYKVHGGLGFFEKWDELYWNAVFEDRNVEVKKAEITIRLSEEFAEQEIKQKLFVGPFGSQTETKEGFCDSSFWPGYLICLYQDVLCLE